MGPVGPVGLVGLTIKPRHSWDRGAGRDRLPLCKRSNGLIVADGSARFTACLQLFTCQPYTGAQRTEKLNWTLTLTSPLSTCYPQFTSECNCLSAFRGIVQEVKPLGILVAWGTSQVVQHSSTAASTLLASKAGRPPRPLSPPALHKSNGGT